MKPLQLSDKSHVIALTGAGVSAESGVPTFRDARGLWRKHRFEDVASPEAFERDPTLVWSFYSERRAGARPVEPNPGHRALAALEKRLGDRFLLATQNVDGLHARAGSQRIVELHGNLFRSKCADCDRAPFDDEAAYDTPPRCDECGGRIRPDIVWFGEVLGSAGIERVQRFFGKGAESRELVFLAVGTSGAVWPAAGFVQVAQRVGARTILVNAEPADNVEVFDTFIQGKSGEVLPKLLGVEGYAT